MPQLLFDIPILLTLQLHIKILNFATICGQASSTHKKVFSWYLGMVRQRGDGEQLQQQRQARRRRGVALHLQRGRRAAAPARTTPRRQVLVVARAYLVTQI